MGQDINNTSGSQTVLVTGGSGYVGTWAIVALLQQGYKVRTTIRSLEREAAGRAAIARTVDPGGHLAFFAADLLRDEGWDQAADCSQFILLPVHTAHRFPHAGRRVQETGCHSPGTRRNAARAEGRRKGGREACRHHFIYCRRPSVPRHSQQPFQRSRLGSRAAQVTTGPAPSLMVRLAGLFSSDARQITPLLGAKHQFSSAKAEKLLGWRPASESIVDCAESLINQGLV